jgi:drug/metabolite transporter (DMT)-like permease
MDGMSGLWALVVTNGLATVLCLVLFRAGLRSFRCSPALVLIGVLAGVTNTTFILGTLLGEVLRVTLLLYLSPLWTIILARIFLDEKIDRVSIGVVALSLTGAVVMLSGDLGLGEHGLGVADMFGLASGLTYAGYNVAVRRACDIDLASKTLVSCGGSLLTAAAVLPFAAASLAAAPLAQTWANPMVWALVMATGALLVAVVLLMQFGLVHIAATRASVIMVSELVFAAASAWWLAGEEPGRSEWLGALLIVAASLLSALATARQAPGAATPGPLR